MKFQIDLPNNKKLIFNSELNGLKIGDIEYLSGRDGGLIYDQVEDIRVDLAELQMSTNTSTLIPALKVLSISYHPYFDQQEVLLSQNDITFYWDKSKLAAFYNKFSTDELDFSVREPVIRKAVEFLTTNIGSPDLTDELLNRIKEPCKLVGFYKGFPVFDGGSGFPKLQSRLGIHIEPDGIMISTPLDKYESDIYELAEIITKETGLTYSKKKNRVVFPNFNLDFG